MLDCLIGGVWLLGVALFTAWLCVVPGRQIWSGPRGGEPTGEDASNSCSYNAPSNGPMSEGAVEVARLFVGEWEEGSPTPSPSPNPSDLERGGGRV